MGLFSALCLLQAAIFLPYLILDRSIVIWTAMVVLSLICGIVCLWGMQTGLIVDTQNKILICKGFFKTKKIPFRKIRSVKQGKLFLYIVGTDGNTFYRAPVSLSIRNCIPPENFAAYLSSIFHNAALLKPSKEREKKQALSSKALLFTIYVIQAAILVIVFIDQWKHRPAYPIVDIKFYHFGVLWAILAITLVALGGLLVKRKHHMVAEFLALVLFFGFFATAFISAFATPADYNVSTTSDFGEYQTIFTEERDSDYLHFPKEIRGEVVDFNYYFDNSWDIIEEIYLEVRYDEAEFARIYSEYAEKEPSYFGAEYEEVTLSDDEFLEAEKGHNDKVYISRANIQKIIFNQEEQTVIYYYLDAYDPFYLDRCHLAKKFDIDFIDYGRYIEEKQT